MVVNAEKFLTKPPADLAGWVRALPVEDLPVLARTAYELEDLREFEEEVDLQMLGDLITSDPLMTAKLFGHVAKRRGRDVDGELEDVWQAVLLLGVAPFFRALSTHTAAEDLLAEAPEALDAFHEALDRARRAGRFAAAFAIQRDDPDAGMIREAALLHSLPELVVWLRTPALAMEVARRSKAAPAANHDAIQKSVLNVAFAELRLGLLEAWRVPAPIAQLISGQAGPDSPQVSNVRLALRAARQDQADWQSTEHAVTVRDIGNFLQLGLQPTWNLLKSVDQPHC